MTQSTPTYFSEPAVLVMVVNPATVSCHPDRLLLKLIEKTNKVAKQRLDQLELAQKELEEKSLGTPKWSWYLRRELTGYLNDSANDFTHIFEKSRKEKVYTTFDERDALAQKTETIYLRLSEMKSEIEEQLELTLNPPLKPIPRKKNDCIIM